MMSFNRAQNFLVIFLTTFFAIQASNSADLCEGFIPENDLNIPVNQWGTDTGISKDEFDQITAKVGKIYSPIIKQKGGQLKIVKLWEDGTVNARASRDENIWKVFMYGGLARYPGMTGDAFALVLCHELGHHLGGLPKYYYRWSSNEGQSDYFAALKCMRKYFADDNNQTSVNVSAVSEHMKKFCNLHYADSNKWICLRTSVAAEVIGNVISDMLKEKVQPSVATPDPVIVATTNNSHPGTQCRVDTYFKAAVCTADVNDELSDNLTYKGNCTEWGQLSGARPRCWFAPTWW